MATNRHFDVGILQPGYLPWLGYFDLVKMSDIFVIYDDVQFDRGGWRNRNRLLGRDGPEWITVPVRKKGCAFRKVRDIELSNIIWPKKHLAMIKTLYGKAPFFDWCFPFLDRLLTGATSRFLLDLCLAGHACMAGLLEINTTIKLASELGLSELGRTERLVAICREMGASRYIAADASSDYMKEALWKDADIELVYQHYPHPAYQQFGESFVSHLSVVDALMFAGPAARQFVGISHCKEIDS